jgi:osmotically-inducible protein OsmY
MAMNMNSRFLRSLVVFMLVFSLAACASTKKQESTGQYIDDSVITAKVKALILHDEVLKAFDISVQTYKGIVLLSGFVSSRHTVDKAGQIAASVRGVKSVRNHLIVK